MWGCLSENCGFNTMRIQMGQFCSKPVDFLGYLRVHRGIGLHSSSEEIITAKVSVGRRCWQCSRANCRTQLLAMQMCHLMYPRLLQRVEHPKKIPSGRHFIELPSRKHDFNGIFWGIAIDLRTRIFPYYNHL